METHVTNPWPNAGSAFLGKRQRRPVLDADQLSYEETLNGNVTLVVVDMQPGFSQAIDKATMDAVERQILLAIKKGWAIVLLEKQPWDNGPTYPGLMRHLKGKYARHMMRVKEADSGARQVVEACDDFDYPKKYFRVCGVFADVCVEKTARGLALRLPGCAVRVIREACNTNHHREEMWSTYPLGPSLVISSEKVGPADAMEPTKPIASIPVGS